VKRKKKSYTRGGLVGGLLGFFGGKSLSLLAGPLLAYDRPREKNGPKKIRYILLKLQTYMHGGPQGGGEPGPKGSMTKKKNGARSEGKKTKELAEKKNKLPSCHRKGNELWDIRTSEKGQLADVDGRQREKKTRN